MAARKLLLLAVLLTLSGCAALPVAPTAAPASGSMAPAGPFELTLVHSNDTWGYLDPCG